MKIAFKRLKKAGNDPMRLELPDQTVVVVTNAQGIIDNGGFRYFFEMDFPYNPPYSFFSAAYRRIGAADAAARLDEASILFPFAAPHFHVDQRNQFMESLPEGHRFYELGNEACGDPIVWSCLAAFVREHESSFRNPKSKIG